jgi:hypothetical protein
MVLQSSIDRSKQNVCPSCTPSAFGWLARGARGGMGPELSKLGVARVTLTNGMWKLQRRNQELASNFSAMYSNEQKDYVEDTRQSERR